MADGQFAECITSPGNQGQLVIAELLRKMDVHSSLKIFGGGKQVVYPEHTDSRWRGRTFKIIL